MNGFNDTGNSRIVIGASDERQAIAIDFVEMYQVLSAKDKCLFMY